MPQHQRAPDPPGPGPGHPAWRALLPAALPSDGLPGLAPAALGAFTDPEDESAALFGGAGALIPLVTRGALRLTGADRIDFVHGQVSHDVRGLRAGEARAALQLDHRGRPQADLVIVRREQDVYLAVDDGRGPAVARGLEAHVVFDQVTVEDLSDAVVSFVVAGEPALARLRDALDGASLPRAAGACAQLSWGGAEVLLHARTRGLAASLDVHLLGERLAGLWQRLLSAGVCVVGERALAAARVAAGLPAAAAEGEGALPQEAGLDDRISYRKGCYLGQEIMARIEARGAVHRRLARLTFVEPPPGGESRDVLDERRDRIVGRVGTVACLPGGRWAGLAVLRNELEHGDRVRALGVGAAVEALPG
jgi:tRNA-modifying protein YgfZ